MTRPASASYQLRNWEGVRPGTIVTLRRGALSGEKAERTKAWTASGPFLSDTGTPVIRVDVAGTIVSYPLARVSLGWEERTAPPPAITIASTLDPPPVPVPNTFVGVLALCGLAYFVCMGLVAIAGWVFR